MIKPSLFRSFLKGRTEITLIMGGAAFAFLLLGSMTTPQQAIQNKQGISKNSTTQLKYVFDVPALVGKNIDEIRSVLGSPVA